MAHITLSGVLLDPTGEFSVGDKVKFTHQSTTGSTMKSAVSVLKVPPNGAYSVNLEYGLVLVEYNDYRLGQYRNLGIATVNATNTATSIPELLNALVPASSAELIEFQAILTDCVTAQNAAAASAVAAATSAAQLTTTELIASTAIYAADVVVNTVGFTTSGIGGAPWKQNGLTGAVSQTPEDLDAPLLNDGNGNQWAIQVDSRIDTSSFSIADYAETFDAYNDVVFVAPESVSFSNILDSTKINILSDTGVLAHTTSNGGTSSVKPYFNPSESLKLKGLKLDGNVISGGRRLAILENSGVSSVDLESVECDFKSVIVDPATGITNDQPGNVLFRFNDSVNDITSIKIKDCAFRRAFWGFLKGNSVVSSESNIKITNSSFDDFSSVALLFNSPAAGSSIENVSLLNLDLGSNTSLQKIGLGSGYPHRGSFAGNVNYAKLIASHAYGDGSEMFRAEENARNVIMALNTAKLNGNDGIEVIPNNVGGVMETPRNFILTSNILNHVGLVNAPSSGWGIGLYTYESAFGGQRINSTTESIVSYNIVEGWDQGLYLHTGMERNIVESNMVIDCLEGMATDSPSLGMRNNMLVDCTSAVTFNEGGMIGRINIRSKTTIPPVTAITTNTVVGVLSGWDWETGFFTGPPVGILEYPIIELGDRIQGTVKITFVRDALYSIVMGELSYDGSTLTFTESLRLGTGSTTISTTAFSITGSNLNIRLFEADEERDNCRLQVDFDGVHVFLP
jgi:hypothetical protein